MCNKDNTGTENEILNESSSVSNVSNYKIDDVNDKIIFENHNSSDSGSTENEVAQFLTHGTLLKPFINFNNIENMIAAFDGSLFQDILKNG